jgi:hypothetical protein
VAQADSGVTVQVDVIPHPATVGLAQVAIQLANAAGGPVAGAIVNVEGDMTHPGMAPVFATARETGGGRYQAGLELTMAGDWVLTVRAKLPDGRMVVHTVDVKKVQPK